MATFSNRIRQARRHALMSQAAFAAALGVSRSAVAQWERQGGARPTTENITKIAVVTSVCFEWLATGRGPRALSPALQAEISQQNRQVQCKVEERLLVAFRRIHATQQMALLDLAEAIGKAS